jgi:4-diphosphocytidyl-2-C-methyl-D-erythritol kinase
MKTVTKKGYAKINLHFDITGRTSDGYHLVQTVMQSISLCDEVTLSLREDGDLSLSCNVNGVPTDEKNLAIKAIIAFREKTGVKYGADIVIKKRIPMAAGMAGGSADAAATLGGFNELCGNLLSTDELCDIGAALGADVPFCIVGGTAYADGKGDILHDFKKMPDCYILAACGGEGVSTPLAYRTLDEMYEGFGEGGFYKPRGTELFSKAMDSGELPLIAKAMYNIFEEPILALRPIAREIRETMKKGGALGAMMSGSGPSVFGIFDKKDIAERVAEEIREKGYFAEVCRPV